MRLDRFTISDPDRWFVFRRGICIAPAWLAGRTEEEVEALSDAELVAMKPREIK
jgi:hypothetical protein